MYIFWEEKRWVRFGAELEVPIFKNQVPNKLQNPINKISKLLTLGFVWFLVVGVLVLPAVASAQIVPCRGLDCDATDLLQILVNIYNFLLGLSALVAMLFIVFGAVRMLYFSYLENSASELEEAKLTVRRAIGGFVIIATAYLVVATLLYMLGLDRSGKPGTVGDILKGLGL